MLYELKRYAEQKGLTAVPGFKEKSVRWIIALDSNGRFIDVERNDRVFPMCPVLEHPELISGNTRQFLVDSVEIVLNIPKNAKDAAKIDQKHESFKKLLSLASEHDPLIRICLDALEKQDLMADMREICRVRKIGLNDSITFRVGGTYPVESTRWHDWWQAYRNAIKKDKSGNMASGMCCFLSGEAVEPARTHIKILGLAQIGGQPSGSSLISFDKEAFESYGLEQAKNAACSESSVSSYAAALDHLIKNAPRPLAGTLFLHWYKEPIPSEYDFLNFMDNAEDTASIETAIKNADKLIEAVNRGERPELSHNRYHILILSGAGGRIMVRSYLQGDYLELRERVTQWFDDISIVSPGGRGIVTVQKLFTLLIRLLPFEKSATAKSLSDRMDKELSPIMTLIWISILQGTQLPDTIAARALAFIRSKMYSSSEEDTDSNENLDTPACQLLKAWYIRKQRNDGGVIVLKEELNKVIQHPAYHAGRMMAVLAEIQREALGEVNSSVIQRYYTSASTSPSLVLGKLVALSKHHLAKMENRRIAIWFDNMLAEISTKLDISKLRTLSLEEQTLFAIGFYQQKAGMYKSNNDNRTENISSTNLE